MAESDAVSMASSQSGEDEIRKRPTMADVTEKFTNEKNVTKHKSMGDGVVEIGATYSIRRLDGSCRKSKLQNRHSFSPLSAVYM